MSNHNEIRTLLSIVRIDYPQPFCYIKDETELTAPATFF